MDRIGYPDCGAVESTQDYLRGARSESDRVPPVCLWPTTLRDTRGWRNRAEVFLGMHLTTVRR
jgi:hypothetical protein